MSLGWSLSASTVASPGSEPGLSASAVIAPDRSRAIYSFAVLGTSITSSHGRLRFPGLDPERRYHVAPVLLGRVPSGLNPPAWWGVERDLSHDLDDLTHGLPPRLRAISDRAGVTLPGSVLAHTGLIEASVNPDHALLFLVEAAD